MTDELRNAYQRWEQTESYGNSADEVLLIEAIPELLRMLAAAEARAEAAERELHTLRVGCEAALQDWQLQRRVDDGAWSPRPGGNDMLRGCVYVYDEVIPLLTKILDGTVADNDFEEAEYDLMLTAGTTDRAALRAVTERENERIRQEMRVPADGSTAARDEHREDKTQ